VSGAPAADFVAGLDLSRGFYSDVVAPLMAGRRHSAARLGEGSEVLGFDTPRSPLIGGIDQFADSTDMTTPQVARAARAFFDRALRGAV
jgi:hypothetical protein